MKAAFINNLSSDDKQTEMSKAARLAEDSNSDILIFPFGYLSTPPGLSFDYQNDIYNAISARSPETAFVSNLAKELKIAVATGFYKNYKGGISSAYFLIDASGRIIYEYDVVSPEWKPQAACADYREGSAIKSCEFHGLNLCFISEEDFFDDRLLTPLIEADCHVDVFVLPFCRHDEKSILRRGEIFAKPFLLRVKDKALRIDQGKVTNTVENAYLSYLII